MPITNQPNLAALQAALLQAITDSQTAVIANTDSKTAAVAQVVVDETDAAATALAGEIATKATETQAAVDAAATATQGAITAKGVIKSVQRGVLGVSGTANPAPITISAVNQSRSFINLVNAGSKDSIEVRGYFSSDTELTFSRSSSTTSNSTAINWEVIEYE